MMASKSNVISGKWANTSTDAPALPLASGGNGTHDGGMEARLDRLESRVDRISDQVGDLRVDVAAIKERLAHVPTKHDLWKALWVSAAVPILGLIAWIVKELVIPLLQR